MADLNNISLKERFRGGLLGLAVGDALGTTLEFKSPGSFEPITQMTGGGIFNLKPGQWTDDTSMALCLAESIIEKKGFDLKDQLEKYVSWFREGHHSSLGFCFDIGNTTRVALETFEKTGNPHSGPTSPRSAGNGSLMRLIPVPLFYHDNPAEAVEKSGESSKSTHGAIQAVDACRYFGALTWGLLNNAKKEDILNDRFSPSPGFWDSDPPCWEIDEIAFGSFREKEPPEIQGTGYVVHTLEAALWAFHHTDTFEEGALKVVNLGNDADTTGAVYGQIAGVYYGEKGIPKDWKEKIFKKELIENYADKLLKLSDIK